MTLGALGSTTGMGLLAMAVARHHLPAFLLATSTAGAGYSLLFLSALDVINRAAPADRRGGVLSALYRHGYLPMAAVAWPGRGGDGQGPRPRRRTPAHWRRRCPQPTPPLLLAPRQYAVSRSIAIRTPDASTRTPAKLSSCPDTHGLYHAPSSLLVATRAVPPRRKGLHPLRSSPSSREGEQHAEAYRAVVRDAVVLLRVLRGWHGVRRGPRHLAIPRGSCAEPRCSARSPRTKALDGDVQERRAR